MIKNIMPMFAICMAFTMSTRNATAALGSLIDPEPVTPGLNCCLSCPTTGTLTYDSSCTDTTCTSCTTTTTTSTTHVVTITDRTFETVCTGTTNVTASGTCTTTSIAYICEEGYYGTPTGRLDTCTACPSNATCGGGSTFSCNKGYYKNGSLCSRCPASGGVYGTTSGTGATAITECYIPADSTFSDSTGSGTYNGDCFYSN